MIPLVLPAMSDAESPFVTRLRSGKGLTDDAWDSLMIEEDGGGVTYAGAGGILAIDGATAKALDGDVVLVQPRHGRMERILRAGSPHNTLLVTERCDQLCVMCSQPPKKTHVDRFAYLEQACLLAEPGLHIGISGGEPSLFKDKLLSMVERVLRQRPDLSFHILSNGQHFAEDDVLRMRDPLYRRVSWGVPLYAASAPLHDEIVGKVGAFDALQDGFATLLMAGARVELRTVLVSSNLAAMPNLSRFVASRLRFIEVWSIMQLEHIGFAKGRWRTLFVDHREHFGMVGRAIDWATMHGVRAQLFNFPRCTVPPAYRGIAIASISDWKRKYPNVCFGCSEQANCSGFFEWHPDEEARAMVEPL
ncbi:His-Xaa-Ser system radical SAM maturase HxsC [Novosphingobium sp. B-7]|uniref:His-Xaa-Ser system radical SAM maturase HxsC n=1 Tax=Novosphingobium sp. B-7 TaxID=1298855 RepID=UPI0003B6E789|nr:His-Xaa-Ser system radical SAM maturase HxsC [Novosphingobium sp. B-7]